ncbi:hypothetical protein OQJ18_05385 [Fluoribacter dumoffii]|uniref:Uncharacterized protein n=1 Tax=Fluoribacter dumoffii TaxID=463 RepID=A0A377GA58_9GAMM|nr:hypothetical protein [Fluoribacter dumoffii]KTC90131.1 hypothetical protein Ldum_1199 [Fluoribacter dumoffii NY 23]MCW8385427.1 hypothetical protein [Fluoribacter dumoffii]MCW8418480.1 hypothetical protein [Fluoribacter dumoffii]MCW8453678.1 hypothetical protein [Fluoribacter dumoffii]MCW8459104.1 hypothetical protein [Fluoribacter dumoffii]
MKVNATGIIFILCLIFLSLFVFKGPGEGGNYGVLSAHTGYNPNTGYRNNVKPESILYDDNLNDNTDMYIGVADVL